MLMAQFQENGYVANKFMDKRHMDQVLQRPATRQKNPSLRPLVLEKSVPITVFNRLTEKERREEEACQGQG